jgi:head-tail adaptor
MTGQRSLEYTAITGFQGYVFTLPYRSDITIDTTRRIVYNSRTFQITSVSIPDEARQELQIIAYEKK